jgi:hypothetical protein
MRGMLLVQRKRMGCTQRIAVNMKYARVNLSQSDYNTMNNWAYINDIDVIQLNDIYKKYCVYKNFDSVMPIFDCQYLDTRVDIIGYYDNDSLIAFSMVKLYDDKNAELLQFAWDYVKPELMLGIESLKNECAIYKKRGFEYLYLGGAEKYKRFLDGFEIIGKL